MSQILSEHAKSILRAIADGKTVQRESFSDSEWVVLSTSDALKWIASDSTYQCGRLRVKPETYSINGQEFSAPVPPKTGQYQYRLEVGDASYSFDHLEDRNIAYQAIVEALEGKSK
jgi:hypothetical protein